MQAYLHTKTKRSDGAFDNFQTIEVPVKIKTMPHPVQSLLWTATGYVARIPTLYMIQVEGSGTGFTLSVTVAPVRCSSERATTKPL